MVPSRSLVWFNFSIGYLLFLCSNVWSVRFNHPELYLSSHDFKISATRQTRNYNFRVTNTVGAPDGFSKTMLVINDQFPGPLIECNEGDTLQIVVQNDLNVDVSIHWHGILQTGTPWMDGVTGVTQCPIPAKTSFTYKFTVKDQFGTFWYHAHARNLAIDGIAGPLIVHSPRDPLVRGKNYDNEMILFISDWYHNTSTVILDGTLSATGYFGTQAAPSANSALINGVGIFNCSFATRGSRCRTPTKPLEITLPPNQKTRFRLIQAGSHAMFWFSADQHLLTVVEADSTRVTGPNNLHRLQFHNGQRYSVIIDTRADKVGSSFYLRAAMDIDCWAWLAPGIPGPDATALAIVRVAAQASQINSLQPPRTKDWGDTVGGKCTDLNVDTLKPLIRQNACANVIDTLYFNTSLGTIIRRNSRNRTKVDTLSRFFVNNATWTTFRYRPLLQDLAQGGKGYLNSTEVTALTLNRPGCYNIVLNNLDAGIDHPLHLHGVDSHLVAQGSGNIGPQNLAQASIKFDNPLRRDTFVVGGGSYLILRVEANNPGVWILHCHIGWHLAAGFAGVVVMQPSAISKFKIPTANQALCSAKTSRNINTTEPGRLSSLM
ncbi:hypothetical protein PtA15_12A99 [Puccinia triticina]|uniref:Laccase n=1 Tax=Puccinia triticina TaxID=208348 RepID=A0ABY7CZT1_9BASI|nr:uncharacterized protein PtA15_12A99 [Puccinia triticina]WAQ90114.1 hypothetical protein PtA15_12A99 [Puccinia triticina]